MYSEYFNLLCNQQFSKRQIKKNRNVRSKVWLFVNGYYSCNMIQYSPLQPQRTPVLLSKGMQTAVNRTLLMCNFQYQLSHNTSLDPIQLFVKYFVSFLSGVNTANVDNSSTPFCTHILFSFCHQTTLQSPSALRVWLNLQIS